MTTLFSSRGCARVEECSDYHWKRDCMEDVAGFGRCAWQTTRSGSQCRDMQSCSDYLDKFDCVADAFHLAASLHPKVKCWWDTDTRTCAANLPTAREHAAWKK